MCKYLFDCNDRGAVIKKRCEGAWTKKRKKIKRKKLAR